MRHLASGNPQCTLVPDSDVIKGSGGLSVSHISTVVFTPILRSSNTGSCPASSDVLSFIRPVDAPPSDGKAPLRGEGLFGLIPGKNGGDEEISYLRYLCAYIPYYRSHFLEPSSVRDTVAVLYFPNYRCYRNSPGDLAVRGTCEGPVREWEWEIGGSLVDLGIVHQYKQGNPEVIGGVAETSVESEQSERM